MASVATESKGGTRFSSSGGLEHASPRKDVESAEDTQTKERPSHIHPAFEDDEKGKTSVGSGSEEEGEFTSNRASQSHDSIEAPPLPTEDVPPLPSETPPAANEADDGWAPVWEETAQAFYFYNRFTGATQWINPRVPEVSQHVAAAAAQPGPPGVDAPLPTETAPTSDLPNTGYNPAVHGDYDPTAWYAQPSATEPVAGQAAADPTAHYAASAAFNRFTGRYQVADLTPENFNDENKSKRQMNAFFDVDAAANSHDGRSLKAERSGKKLSKTELKQFKEKRKAKKEEKRRAWLRD
ncbi:WW domain protein [Diplocarpon rosae]|nr:WW domain protein [Diplocarpon rosae]